MGQPSRHRTRRLELGPTLLLTVVLSAALLVKETTALVLLPFPVFAVLLRAGMLAVRHFRGQGSAEELRNAWRTPLLGGPRFTLNGAVLARRAVKGDLQRQVEAQWRIAHPAPAGG